jgi:hypothetical protein
MNGSRGIPNSKGFRLSLLRELPNIKCLNENNDPKKCSSLMDYLVDSVAKHSPLSINLQAELIHLQEASQIKTSEVLADLEAVKNDLRKLEKRIAKVPQAHPQDGFKGAITVSNSLSFILT